MHLHQPVDDRIMLGLATAGRIAVIALATLLAKATQLAQTVIHLHRRIILPLPGQFTGTPLQVNADHVVHAKRPHGEAEALQRCVHLLRPGAFEQQHARLAHVGVQHAVADKAVAVAGHHRHLAHARAQLLSGLQHGWRGLAAADDLQQFHDVRRAEEVQTQHRFWPRGDCSDSVDIQRRGVAG